MKTKNRLKKPNKAKVAVIRKRPKHKKIMLHPGSIFLMLLIGVILVSSTLYSSADSYTVNAVVPAPAITTPATITSPSDGQVFTTSPITVSGACVDNSYVDLIRDGYYSGTAICNNEAYSIETDLSPGSNALVAQIYNVTNQAGPPSNTITVTYNPPTNPSNPPTTTGSSSSAGSSTTPVANSAKPSDKNLYNNSGLGTFILDPAGSTYKYKTFTNQLGFTWDLNLTGGTPPYVVNVNWGDGSTSVFYFKTDPLFKITHDYKKSGTYNIVITAVDSLGEQAVFQLSTKIVKAQPSAFGTTGVGGGISKATNGLGFFKTNHNLLDIAGSVYVVILLMTVSFWLGERRELKLILNKKSGYNKQRA
jgi:hypothetical protein